MISGQPAIRVVVNDRQLPVAAIADDGRVLVPLRAVVEALGGDISQFHAPFPAPSRVVGGRTYVPIRYVATRLNTDVEYDARARIVQLFAHQTVAAGGEASPSPGTGPIQGHEPAANARVGSPYPTISATVRLSRGASISTLHMLVDRVDVTNDAQYAGLFVTYIPRDALSVGVHTVAISGTGTDGRRFDEQWSFETTTAASADVVGPGFSGAPLPGYSAIELNVSGNQFVGGSPISVQMTAPPGGQAFAFVCTSAWHFPLYAAPLSQFYSAAIPTTSVGAAINCPITAMYIGPDGTVTYAPYPVFVQLLPPQTPSPRSTPSPQVTRVPLPPTVRRTPSPAQTPLPARTPAPHARIGTPRVRPTPPQ